MVTENEHPFETPRAYFDRLIAEKMASGHYEASPGQMTIGALISAVMVITDPEDAQAFYVGYVSWLGEQGALSESPESIAKANIGWCFGEGMAAGLRQMWNEVTGAAHPVFGAVVPSSEDAFKAGMAWAKDGAS